LLSAFNRRIISYMSPTLKHKPTDGATRAAKQIERNPSFVHSTAELIDRETGVRELADILEKVTPTSLKAAVRHWPHRRALPSGTMAMRLQDRLNNAVL
jgi:hypothetical protein